MSDLHVNRSRVDAISIDIGHCPDCAEGYRYGRRQVAPRKARPRLLAWFQEWYGWHTTCLRCGAQWVDGELLVRPFSPGWRAENVKHAKALWRKHRDRLSRIKGEA